MATQLLFSDLMAAAAVVASSTSAGPTTTSTLSNGNNSGLLDTTSVAFYPAQSTTNGNGPANGGTGSKGGYLEDQRALQLAFELSMLNNNGTGADGNVTNNGASNASTTSSMGHAQNAGDLNPGFYMNTGVSSGRQQGSDNGHDYENALHHFLGSGSHEPALNNLGSAATQHYHQSQQQQQISYDDMTLEKFLLNQNMATNGGDMSGNGGDYYSHQQQQPQQQPQQQQHRNGNHPAMNHHNTTTLNNLINGISSINLNNINGSGHGYGNGNNGGQHHGGGGNGLMNETERFKKSQNMTECVPVPSSEHVAEIVGRQGKVGVNKVGDDFSNLCSILGCKIKALRAKTNTYIKTPVRGEEPVFVVTGRKEDVAKAKKEILSAAEHFSLIRASRKPSLTNASSAGSSSGNGLSSPLLSAASGGAGSNGLGDIFSSGSGSGDDSPSILTKNPIGLTSAAAAAAAAGHNQITVQVRVPYRVVGLVVGPKGATIKNIQQQTHTYIVTPSRDKEPIFEVTGAVENVEIARQQIEAHIAMRTGGNSDSTDNLTSYLNSVNSRNGSSLDGGLKKELQDELQLLNENFGQSTNFLRKYLNGHGEDQLQQQQQQSHQEVYASAFHGTGVEPKQQQTAANLAAMELLMSQLYQENQVSGSLADVDMPSSVDLFGNRIRIDELLQSMQQKQHQNNTNTSEFKRDRENHLSMSRNTIPNDFTSNTVTSAVSVGGGFGCMKGNKPSNYYGPFSGVSDDQGSMLRRQLLSNNSEDDEGVGLEQESSPPATSTNIMKMIMDGTEEDKKYLWSTLSAAVVANNNGATNGGGTKGAAGELMMGNNVNHSSDSSCLSSASPSPTLSKFFTFQNGGAALNGGAGSKDRSCQDGEL